jgi:hypothetical protein
LLNSVEGNREPEASVEDYREPEASVEGYREPKALVLLRVTGSLGRCWQEARKRGHRPFVATCEL